MKLWHKPKRVDEDLKFAIFQQKLSVVFCNFQPQLSKLAKIFKVIFYKQTWQYYFLMQLTDAL